MDAPGGQTTRCALATLVLRGPCVKPNGKERDALRRDTPRDAGGFDVTADDDVTGRRLVRARVGSPPRSGAPPGTQGVQPKLRS
jgi:hypothetical protein